MVSVTDPAYRFAKYATILFFGALRASGFYLRWNKACSFPLAKYVFPRHAPLFPFLLSCTRTSSTYGTSLCQDLCRLVYRLVDAAKSVAGAPDRSLCRVHCIRTASPHVYCSGYAHTPRINFGDACLTRVPCRNGGGGVLSFADFFSAHAGGLPVDILGIRAHSQPGVSARSRGQRDPSTGDRVQHSGRSAAATRV